MADGPQKEEGGVNDSESQLEKWIPPLDDYTNPSIDTYVANHKEKQRLEDIINGIQHSDVYRMFGVKPDRSFLLYGPPGTGKTHWAKCIRNELLKRGVDVVWAEYSVGEYGTAYINMGARNLQLFYDQVVKLAHKHDVVIVFKDEVDAIYGKRGQGSNHKEDDKLLTTEMTNLQNIDNSDLNIINIMATNFYENLDPAAIRAGRINRHVEFNLPSLEELMSAYQNEIQMLNKGAIWEVITAKDYQSLAKASLGFSYAEVHNIVDNAVRTLVNECLRREDGDIKKVDHVNEERILREIGEFQGYHIQKDSHKRVGFT